ncbi:hypothetical protein Bbelb_342410 [Branchiostoma belcheri]|nr:hypothetical protein Bbelb_342410 [Branchiostoma belcheri]
MAAARNFMVVFILFVHLTTKISAQTARTQTTLQGNTSATETVSVTSTAGPENYGDLTETVSVTSTADTENYGDLTETASVTSTAGTEDYGDLRREDGSGEVMEGSGAGRHNVGAHVQTCPGYNSGSNPGLPA